MHRDDLIEFITAHPETIDDISVKMNANAIPHLLETKFWPKATPDSLIVHENNEEQRRIRAKAIMKRYLRTDLTDKKFLDFGAGVSDCVQFATGAKEAVAYDIVAANGVITDFREIINRGPYDVILLYDVIDHLVDNNGDLLQPSNIAEVLKMVANVLQPKGTIYVRCHPWISRHGTHAYTTINKAFVHYVTDTIGIPTIRITTPIIIYNDAFERAGLKVVDSKSIDQPLEPFFDDPVFEYWKEKFTEANKHVFKKAMSYSFFDFKLHRL